MTLGSGGSSVVGETWVLFDLVPFLSTIWCYLRSLWWFVLGFLNFVFSLITNMFFDFKRSGNHGRDSVILSNVLCLCDFVCIWEKNFWFGGLVWRCIVVIHTNLIKFNHKVLKLMGMEGSEETLETYKTIFMCVSMSFFLQFVLPRLHQWFSSP